MYDNIRIIIAPIILLFIFSCDDMATNVTGSENVNEIANVSFSNIEKTITQNGLKVTGIITNNNQTLSISPPWYIECQFYYENSSGNTFLIGGANTLINNSLSPGISLEWTLPHQTDNPEDYANFIINELRAYKN